MSSFNASTASPSFCRLTQCLLQDARTQQRKSWKEGQNLNPFTADTKAVVQKQRIP